MTILPLDRALLPPAALAASIKGIRYATAFFITRADFDHLRQEHLAGTKEVADDVHAIHQRAFDDLQRPFSCRRASSVSRATKSSMPLTSAYSSRFVTGRLRHARSSTLLVPLRP